MHWTALLYNLVLLWPSDKKRSFIISESKLVWFTGQIMKYDFASENVYSCIRSIFKSYNPVFVSVIACLTVMGKISHWYLLTPLHNYIFSYWKKNSCLKPIYFGKCVNLGNANSAFILFWQFIIVIIYSLLDTARGTWVLPKLWPWYWT